MKKVFYLVTLVGIVFFSCQNPGNEPNPNEGRKYSVTISAEKVDDDSSGTRVEMIDGVLNWSVDDKVGMFITEAGTNNVVVNNIVMDGQHEQAQPLTHFMGALTFDEISELNQGSSYDHITYYPYNADVSLFDNTATISQVDFNLPQTITVRKNEFPSEYAFMVSTEHNRAPMTWLDENGEQQYGERITFAYHHALAYYRLKLDANLMSQTVTKIDMQSISANDHYDRYIAGWFRWHEDTGMCTPVNADRDPSSDLNFTTRTIIIDGGMSGGDEIYIPMPTKEQSPDVYLTLTFTFANGTTYTKTMRRTTDIVLVAGTVYPVSFRLPIVVDFNEITSAVSLPTTYKGWAFQGVGQIRPNRGMLLGNGANAIVTPPLDLGNNTSVRVNGIRFMFYPSTFSNEPWGITVNSAATSRPDNTIDDIVQNMGNGRRLTVAPNAESVTITFSAITLNADNSRITIVRNNQFGGDDFYFRGFELIFAQ